MSQPLIYQRVRLCANLLGFDLEHHRFLNAIEIARQQEAKALELRAMTSLPRLWQQQGKRDEARQMLAKLYNWFTEGFDTKDLQEAKALLAQLAEGQR